MQAANRYKKIEEILHEDGVYTEEGNVSALDVLCTTHQQPNPPNDQKI